MQQQGQSQFAFPSFNLEVAMNSYSFVFNAMLRIVI